MSPRKRPNRRKSNKILKSIIPNMILGILIVLVCGFLTSSFYRMFYNSGIESDYPDLSTLLTKTPYEKQTGHKIQVEIWNGCGIHNLAVMYTDFLRDKGLDVMDSKNAAHFNYLETTILHHRGDFNRALVLADILMIDKSSIVDDKDENLFYDLTLILGKDYIELPSYRDAVLFQPPF